MKTSYLDTEDKLLKLNDLSSQTRLALDSEFIRKRTYYPILSLVQLATDEHLYLIDALALQNRHADLTPLCKLLFDPKIEKTIHCLSQDAEILKNRCKETMNNVFDTQLAAAFLGFELQISYKELVHTILNITLEKSETRSDWTQRPLSGKQLNYAKEDVMHLFELQDVLVEKLHHSGKYEWFAEEINNQMCINNDYCTQFLSKEINFNPQQLACLKILLEWREQKAQQRNLPRQWIANDACIRELAMHGNAAATIRELKHCGKKRNYYVDKMLRLLNKSEPVPLALEHPKPKNQSALSHPEIRERVKKMRNVVTMLAEEHRIAPALIINKKQLVAIAANKMEADAFSGWRADLVSRISHC